MASSIGYGYQGTQQNPSAPSNTNVVLFSVFNLGAYSNAYVSFWYNMPLLPQGSALRVNANTSGNLNDTGSIFTASNTTNGWIEGFANLSAFAGQSPTLYFYYSGSGGEGAMLDDITVYTDTQSESVPPTAKLLTTLSNITTTSYSPVGFEVEYDDNTAIEPASIAGSNIEVLLNGVDEATAQLQSMQVNSDGSVDASYTYLPTDNAWDSNDNGTYTLQVSPSSVYDTSGNSVASVNLGTFTCGIPESVDSVVFTYGTLPTATVGQSGGALPDLSLGVYGIDNWEAETYTADIYLVPSATISASTDNELLGTIPFTVGADGSSMTSVSPTDSGISVPSGLAMGTYAIGVHVNPPSYFPDPNDANNWAVVGYVTVQPTISNPTVVSVMVLYTPQAASSVGGDAAIEQQVNSYLAYANTAMINSDIAVQLQLAYVGEIDYTESGSAITDLTNLQAGDDGLSSVPALRAQYDADLVSLWTSTSSEEIVGEAFIGGAAGDADLGYSVIVAPEAPDYDFAHELGHNFGAGHAVGDSSGENSDNGLYSYSHGWRFTTSDGSQYHDIMAYPPGTTIQYYSNPNIDYLGEPTGTDDANNALTISQDAANVATYGDPPPAVTVSASAPTPTTTEGSSTPGDFRVTANIPTSYDQPITIAVPLSYYGSPSESDYQTPSASVAITIPAGSTSAFADIPITAIDDGVDESDEILTMTIGDGSQYTISTSWASIYIADSSGGSSGNSGGSGGSTGGSSGTIIVSPSSLQIPIDGNGSVMVSLGAEPTGAITVSISEVAGGASFDLGAGVLNFDQDDWSIPQELTIHANTTSRPGQGTISFSGDGASAQLVIIETNPLAPGIGTLVASPASTNIKGKFVITASNVMEGADGGKFTITFYRDAAGTGVFSPSDPILGTDKSAAGGWSIKVPAKTLAAGSNTIFAVATDMRGESSAAQSCVVSVIDTPPTIKTFTAKVGKKLPLVANIAVSGTDSDGKVAKIIVWIDDDGSDTPEAGEEVLTGGAAAKGALSVQAGETYDLAAIAYDNEGVASEVKRIRVVG